MRKIRPILTDKGRVFLQQAPFLARAMGLALKAAPGWSLLWIGVLIVQGLLPAAIVYLSKILVDSLVAALGSGSALADVRPLLWPLMLLVLTLVLMAVAQSGLKIIRSIQSQMVQDRISAMIQRQCTQLDMSFYESSVSFDKLHRAKSDSAHRSLELVEALSSLLQNSITLTAMALILIPYGWWAPAALSASTLPVLFVVLYHRLRYYRWSIENTENERLAWYYDWLLTGRDSAAEIRIFSLAEYFGAAFSRLREILRSESLALTRTQAGADLGAALFALLVTGLAMAWMVWRAVAGAFTMGDLALFYQAFNQGQRLMRALLENLGRMYGNSLFLADFFDFLDLKPRIGDPEHPQPVPEEINRRIRLQNVSFSYPGSSGRVLDGFSLNIEAGAITAVVGANGAGKSTLIKLLCRLYDPDSGIITFDDIDIRDFALADLRRMVTVLFQEPLRYHATVADNIWFGDIRQEKDQAALAEAARVAGSERLVAGLADAYRTRLGRWFENSIELSGGEWQRLALARAFFRKAPIIILDEPTSGMDSWSEIEWLRRFRRLARGRTTFIIAHRLTTAMQADIIHVLDQGKIIESGSHAQLLAQNGRYAASWHCQMSVER